MCSLDFKHLFALEVKEICVFQHSIFFTALTKSSSLINII